MIHSEPFLQVLFERQMHRIITEGVILCPIIEDRSHIFMHMKVQ